MNFSKHLFLLFLIIFTFSNCTNDGNAATQTTAAAICDCTQPLVALNQEMKKLMEKGKIEDLTILMEKAERINEKVIKCAQKNDLKDIKKETLKNALIKNCEMNERMAEGLTSELITEK